MRDFLPHEKWRREELLHRIVSVYRQRGFAQIETPVMEDLSRLTSGMGGDNEKLAFRVLRRGLDAERIAAAGVESDLSDLGLRYDLTVPLARFYASHRAELPTPFRAIQTGPVFRAERPQKGRYRQFVQCDIDILGEPTLLAECELVTATAAALRAAGLDGFFIRVNDRRLLDAVLAWSGFDPGQTAAALISIDKLDKIGVDGVLEELSRTAVPETVERLGGFLHRVDEVGSAPLTAEAIQSVLGPVQAEDAVASLAELGRSVAAWDDAPELRFDASLVRGMGYYTGTIFEIEHPDFPSSVGGGGRYDGMVGRFLGQDVPACGFSIGFERLTDLLPDLTEPEGGLVLLAERDTPLADLIAVKAQVAASGRRVAVARAGKHTARTLDEFARDGFDAVARLNPGARADTLTETPLVARRP
jgi:histidyl-tRNA synthetase